MEVEQKLAEFVVDCTYEDIPPYALDVIKNTVLRVAGTTLAGAKEEGCSAVLNLVREWGGKEEATILVYGGKVPAHNAVLVNGYMARALDFDDVQPGCRSGNHVGAQTVPVALAMAELLGGASGKKVLAALTAGTEASARIHYASSHTGFDATGVCGIFAGTAVAAKMLGLNSEKTLHALGLAFNRAAGSNESIRGKSLAVRMVEGFSAHDAIRCALLAERGITGPRTFLTGELGYFFSYTADGYDHETLIGELGVRFDLRRTFFKRHPACTCTASATDAILELIANHRLTPENVSGVNVKFPPYMVPIVGLPFKIGSNPRVDAQFSIQYCVASALLRGRSSLMYFTEEYIRDSQIAELIKMVHIEPDQMLDKNNEGYSQAAHVTVTTNNGKVYNKLVERQRGLPENPLTAQEQREIFKDCCNYAGIRADKSRIQEIISSVSNMEEIQDIRNLIPLLLSA